LNKLQNSVKREEDKMLRRRQNAGKKIAIGAAVAGAVGYVTGILTAPKSGKETRKQLAEEAEGLKESTEDELQKLNNELKDLIKQTKVKTVALSSGARAEFNEAVIRAKDAQKKSADALKAFKEGEADDPELNKAVKQAKQAQKNLSKFFKK
jgi:gas vesicle protein